MIGVVGGAVIEKRSRVVPNVPSQDECRGRVAHRLVTSVTHHNSRWERPLRQAEADFWRRTGREPFATAVTAVGSQPPVRLEFDHRAGLGALHTSPVVLPGNAGGGRRREVSPRVSPRREGMGRDASGCVIRNGVPSSQCFPVRRLPQSTWPHPPPRGDSPVSRRLHRS